MDARVVNGVEAMPSNTEANPSNKTLTDSNRPPFAPGSSLAVPWPSIQREGLGALGLELPARSSRWRLLLLALEAGDKHLLGPLGGPEIILEDAVEELH